jgi:hypothetical protein
VAGHNEEPQAAFRNDRQRDEWTRNARSLDLPGTVTAAGAQRDTRLWWSWAFRLRWLDGPRRARPRYHYLHRPSWNRHRLLSRRHSGLTHTARGRGGRIQRPPTQTHELPRKSQNPSVHTYSGPGATPIIP